MKQHHDIQLPTINTAGFVKVSVVEKGKVVRDYPVQRNLILDSGIDAMDLGLSGAQPHGRNFEQMMRVCVAGTGTTPTKDLVTGTAAQSGTTVTLSGSAYSFGGGDVGKWIKWTSGEEAKITAYISPTQVTVNKTQTVASGSVVGLFRCNQTGLTTELKRAGSTTAATGTHYPVFTASDSLPSQGAFGDTANERCTLRRTFDFTEEVSGINYTEIGLSYTTTTGANLFSRILLAGAVTVTAGQQLRVQYDLQITLHNITSSPEVVVPITGWPVEYNVTGITSDSTKFTVTTSAAHHFVVGGKLNLSGIKRPGFVINSATSTGSDFTLVTSSSHGYSPGDLITIEGMTPTGYNGSWTAAAGTTGTTIVVTTTANPGTGTVFGLVRLANPSPWYGDEEYTINAVTSTTIECLFTGNYGTAGNAGVAKNNTKGVLQLVNWGIVDILNTGTISPTSGGAHDEAFWYIHTGSAIQALMEPRTLVGVMSWTDGAKSVPAFGAATVNATVTSTNLVNPGCVKRAYVPGSFEWITDTVFTAGVLNANNIRTFALLGTDGTNAAAIITPTPTGIGAYLTLNERQFKDSVHKLSFAITKRINRVLA